MDTLLVTDLARTLGSSRGYNHFRKRDRAVR